VQGYGDDRLSEVIGLHCFYWKPRRPAW